MEVVVIKTERFIVTIQYDNSTTDLNKIIRRIINSAKTGIGIRDTVEEIEFQKVGVGAPCKREVISKQI